MADDTGRSPTLSPNEAFALLGNETRVAILRTLGEVDEPLSFTELRKRVGIRQGAQFNYHLDKLVGHFVRRSERGYELRESGKRIIEAVLSGAVTDDPSIEPTQIDMPCTYCGAPIEISYRQDWLETYCTECAGAYTWKRRESIDQSRGGHLGGALLPAAGVIDRTPTEVFIAALSWGHLRLIANAAGFCPACSSSLERRWTVCETHETTDEVCEVCGQRFAVRIHLDCPNCIHRVEGLFVNGIMANTEVQAFLMSHGINLLQPSSNPWWEFDFDEEVVSTEPLQARFTLSVGDDELVIVLDDGRLETEG